MREQPDVAWFSEMKRGISFFRHVDFCRVVLTLWKLSYWHVEKV
jgi:hypothetical protein